eukprot:6190263-Pleurochrysis_carterae.AAC.6
MWPGCCALAWASSYNESYFTELEELSSLHGYFSPDPFFWACKITLGDCVCTLRCLRLEPSSAEQNSTAWGKGL